jgi:hypothetical protein
VAVVKLLLDSMRFDIEAKETVDEQTPLFFTISERHEVVVKVLLDNGLTSTRGIVAARCHSAQRQRDDLTT